jgi:putative acetyltransferase
MLNQADLAFRTGLPNDLEWMHGIRRAAILGVQADVEPAAREAWADRRRPDSFIGRVAGGEVIIASLAGEDIGWGSSAADHIGALYVSPAYARRGVGRTLLAKLEAAVAQRGHELVRLESSVNAVSFYERLGYVQSGSLRVDGSLPMRKRLPGPAREPTAPTSSSR